MWIGFILVFVLWFLMHLLIDVRLVPNPLKTIATLVRLLIGGEMLVHIAYSLYRLFLSILFALVLGVATGIVMGMNRRVEGIMAPFVYVMFPVPKAALLPVIFVLFGLGDGSKVILIWLILFFQIVLAVYDSVKAIDGDVFLSAKTLKLTTGQLYRHIVFPAILPHVLSALRTSVGIGIAVLFFAETYATDKGLGYFVMNNWSLLNYEEMYSGILILGGIGYAIFRSIDLFRIKTVKWIR